MKIKGLLIINDLGMFGAARKLHYKLGNENFYCYIYNGNPIQNFIVTDKGNVVNNNLGGEILRSAMNYVFYNN